MTRRHAILLAVVAAAIVALADCASLPKDETSARAVDEEAVAARAAWLDADHARRFVVVQDGEVVAAATAPDDAVRAAERKRRDPFHRFVFRPPDRGERRHRMAFLPDGGLVAGQAFVAALRATASWSPGQQLVLERLGRRREMGEAPRLAIEVETLDREHRETLDVVFDPDFDGSLVLPAAVAQRLRLHLFEVPGRADVQVALGRPFEARRAMVLVRISAIDAAGPVEALFEVPSAGASPPTKP